MTEPSPPRASLLIHALSAIVALVGLADAVYLTAEHLSGRSVKCLVVSGCDEVLSSSYATIAGGIPLAVPGALAYFTVFSLSTLAAFGYRRAAYLIPFLVALMLGMTLWLLYVQAFVLHAFCTYCLLSAALTFILSFLTAWQLSFLRRRRPSAGNRPAQASGK